MMSSGAFAFEDAKLDEGLADYREAIRKQGAGDVKSADEALAHAAEAALQKKPNLKVVIRHFERAVFLKPDSAVAWAGLAASRMGLSKSDRKAAQAFYRAHQVVESNEEKAGYLALLAGALSKQYRPKAAILALRESLALHPNDKVQKTLNQLDERHGFRATGVAVDVETDRPEACLQFRGKLGKARNVRYADYVRVEPAVDGDVVPRGNRLCLGGVGFGKSYKVTALKGLPAADGETLPKDISFDVSVGNRTPSVAFKSGTYVLPRAGSAGAPLFTVNVDKVHVKVLRVPERNVIRMLQGGDFLTALSGYGIRSIEEEDGHLLWKGEMDIDATANQRVATAVPVHEIIEKPEPGLYLLLAENAGKEVERWETRATQWMVVSDMGLLTMRGEDGLNVFARSLETAKPRPGVTVRLFGRDNGLLGEAKTDESGQARLDPGLLKGEGGRRPRALYAFSDDGDFAFMDMTPPAFDLSDRGVGGRVAPTGMDAFVYSDRGVYRRGETARIMALLRDAAGRAVGDMPLTVRVLRPDDSEAKRFVVRPSGPGGYHVDVAFPETARTGKWSIRASVEPEGPVLGRHSVLVEDIVPPTIEAKLTSDAKRVRVGRPVQATLQADFLYGAPAGGLPTEAEVTILPDEAPYPEHKGYRFGLSEEKAEPKRQTVKVKATNQDGKAALDILLRDVPDVSRPLKAVIRAGVFEPGGRPVNASLTLPVRQRENAIGVKPAFQDDAVKMDTAAEFDVIVVGPDGASIAGEVEYTLYAENWRYRWFMVGGSWDYKVEVEDAVVAGGKLTAAPGNPAYLTTPVLDWGRYRLEVADMKTGAATSVRFRAGWFVAPSAGNAPDKLEVVADRKGYSPGETVKLHVKAPFAGEALLAFANTRVLETRSVPVPAEGATVEIPFGDDWGVGVYVLATAFRPDAEERGPGRAIGVAWLGLDKSNRALDVVVDAPDDIRPRRTVKVPVTVKGGVGRAHLTLAAVDEGVLQLTGFKTPDPVGHLMGKRKLGVAVRDLYGRLIDGKAKRRGAIRSGGGDPRLGGRGAPPVDARIVALFSGVVETDIEGRAEVSLDVPDFAGRLRLMAVAYDEVSVGAGEDAMLVRDPLVAQISTPRYLAPGDESRITLSLRNLTAPEGEYKAAIAFEGPVETTGEGAVAKTLKPGEAVVASLAVKATGVGVAKARIAIEGPDGFKREMERALAVRPAQFRVTRALAKHMAPGEALAYSSALKAEFLPGTASATLAFSPRPALDVKGILKRLDRYPYGCLEQTTSRALPLVYLDDVAEAWESAAPEPGADARVQNAVYRVFDMQTSEGGFSLWGGDDREELWLGAFAMDFLVQAKAKGYAVPEFSYARALERLGDATRRGAATNDETAVGAAYAFHVLARAGLGDVARLRYFADTYKGKMPTTLAAAQTGAALLMHGEGERGREYFDHARALLEHPLSERGDYGTRLRDAAALVALLAEAQKAGAAWAGGHLADVVPTMADLQASETYLSTQEMAWLTLAAKALAEPGAKMRLAIGKVKGKARKTPLYLTPELSAKPVTYKNVGAGPIWHSATVEGVPAKPEPAMGEGFAIERSLHTLDGKPVDLANAPQNALLVAVIKGKATTGLNHQALVVDLLPAGLEIENARLSHGRAAKEIGWLPKLSKARHEEFRDDRYIAALDLDGGEGERKFALAYLVRAVTPGSYALPAVLVEDMYKPRYRARSDMGRMTVTAPE